VSGPILVTGMPRSGTTWVAHMLAAGGQVAYINEPLNPQHPPGGFPGVLDARISHRFQYICPDNEGAYLGAYRDLLRLRYRPLAEVRRNHHPRDLPHQLHHLRTFMAGRLRRRRLLVADPYAVFSIPWFVRRLGFQVVVVVRRPVAAVASRKRLGWIFEPEELRRQPLLVRDVLDPLGIATGPAREPREERIIDTGALLWAAVHRSIDASRQELDGVHVVRHEDLSREPQREFARLSEWLGLEFGSRSARTVERATTAARSETPVASPHQVQLDSRANLDNWRRRLTSDEVRRIDGLTTPVVQRFYPEGD
jgi:Sulfotransferase family